MAQWFPEINFELIATSGPDVLDGIGRHCPSEDGYLRFNLIVTYGVGEHSTSYLNSMTYKSFCEGEVGRHLGSIDTAHEMRNVCKREIAILDKQIAAYGGGHGQPYTSPGQHLADIRREVWKKALNSVPLFGWHLAK
jgi:hypothetical protein